MITVEYLPGDQNLYWDFDTETEFVDWLVDYICDDCYTRLYEHRGPGPYTIGQLLCTGCGCELAVDGLKEYK